MKIVIKIGSSNLIKNSNVDKEKLEKLSEVLFKYRDKHDFVIVSSGSIGVGRKILGLEKEDLSIVEKQALSAIGQPDLIKEYKKKFIKKGMKTAQILLTKAELHNRERYLNARETIEKLLEYKVIPIINENDTISNEEIKIGDNDTLSAIVSSTINADKMIILSDVEGLYDKNPKIYKNARLIPEVHEITDIILKNSGGAGSNFGTGGMKTKIDAAQICMKSGIDMYIIKGDNINNLRNILEGKSVGTRFFPENKEEANKKMWIAYGRRENGKLIVDNGASKALCNGKSLLATGVKKVIGDFKVGHMVRIYDENNNEIARGLSNYTKKEMKKIKGKKSSEIEKILGYKYQDEVIHRNNMLII
ncbi:MAG: glutamate 5-kinase [Fusobacteriota bacterium]